MLARPAHRARTVLSRMVKAAALHLIARLATTAHRVPQVETTTRVHLENLAWRHVWPRPTSVLSARLVDIAKQPGNRSPRVPAHRAPCVLAEPLHRHRCHALQATTASKARRHQSPVPRAHLVPLPGSLHLANARLALPVSTAHRLGFYHQAVNAAEAIFARRAAQPRRLSTALVHLVTTARREPRSNCLVHLAHIVSQVDFLA